MKWIHNDKVSLGWAILVEIVVHLLFAFQAFLLGGFLGEIALQSFFGKQFGAQLGAWALAVFVFGAAFQAFVLGEYMREHVESFESTAKGDGSYIANWKRVRWIVGGLEISSLLFRCIVVTLQGDYLQAGIVALFGILALWYAFAQAKVIHASVNRPVEYDVYAARQKMTRDIVKDALDYSDDMSTYEKSRFLGGETGVIDEARARREANPGGLRGWLSRKQDKKQRQEEQAAQKQRQEEQEFSRARGMTDQLISYPEQVSDPFMRAQASDLQRARSNGLGAKNSQN